MPTQTKKPQEQPQEQQEPHQQVQWVTVDENNAGQRLDNFLITLLKGVPRSYIYRIIRSGEVRINKGRAQATSRVQEADEIRIPPVRLPKEKPAPYIPTKTFPTLYEDNYLLVINKPAGLAVHGGSGIDYGLIEQLKQSMPQYKMLELVHRLDRDTSGAIIVAKRRSTLTAIQQQFRDREPQKTYLTLVKGIWSESAQQKQRVIDNPLQKYLTAQGERRVRVVDAQNSLGKHAVTLVRCLKVFKDTSLLSVTIKTGRTHQIRVHLTHLGYPIIGDDKYGDFDLNKRFAGEYNFKRMFLHAYELSFDHPQLAEKINIQAPLPPECEKLIQTLENNAKK